MDKFDNPKPTMDLKEGAQYGGLQNVAELEAVSGPDGDQPKMKLQMRASRSFESVKLVSNLITNLCEMAKELESLEPILNRLERERTDELPNWHLYIGDISPEVTIPELEAAMHINYGQITSLILKRTEDKCDGYIKMKCSKEDAMRVLKEKIILGNLEKEVRLAIKPK